MLGHPHWAVIPDIIGGSEQENKNTLEDWPFQKDLGSPVWHINLSFDYLSFLIDNYSKVCFGRPTISSTVKIVNGYLDLRSKRYCLFVFSTKS